MSKRVESLQKLVHKLKYDGGDCISEHLRVLFPDLHSKFCDEAVLEVVGYMASDSMGIFDEWKTDHTGPC